MTNINKIFHSTQLRHLCLDMCQHTISKGLVLPLLLNFSVFVDIMHEHKTNSDSSVSALDTRDNKLISKSSVFMPKSATDKQRQ